MSRTMIPTMALRLVQSDRDDAEPPILQQMFIDPRSNAQMWESVPIVYAQLARESAVDAVREG